MKYDIHTEMFIYNIYVDLYKLFIYDKCMQIIGSKDNLNVGSKDI